jgi:hypothetical protein
MFPVQSDTFFLVTRSSVGLTDLVVYVIVGLQSGGLLNKAIPWSFFFCDQCRLSLPATSPKRVACLLSC